MNDPYTSRSGVDIKKLRGKKHDIYRLRVGDHRFEYFIEEGIVWIERAFKRGKEYQQDYISSCRESEDWICIYMGQNNF